MIRDCKRRNRIEKPWRNKRRGSFGKPIELCLCSTCANTFHLMDDHYIKRVNRHQKYKDSCCMCGVKYGFDYKIYDNSKANSLLYI